MSYRTVLADPLAEKVTHILTGVLKDETDTPIASSSLSALTWTHYDKATGGIINSRDHVSILNTNGGTVDANGNWTLTLTPADSPIMSPAAVRGEVHEALIEWTWASGTKAGKQVIVMTIANIAKVT